MEAFVANFASAPSAQASIQPAVLKPASARRGTPAWSGPALAALCGTFCQVTKPRRAARRGWGDDVSFFDATVKENVEAAEGLRLISIEAPEEVSSPFQRGGQFVQAKASEEDKASFYAVSSPPSKGELEFLIKDVESNAWLTSSGAGDLVKLSEVMGKGFDLDCEAWKNVSQVSIFATGSGIAPIRAVIESGALAGKQSRLYLGARREGAIAYADRFEDWRSQGIEVIPALSQGEESWKGRRGYVQEVMREDEERGEGFVLSAKHGALLCGQKEMVAAVRKVYEELGVPEERTLLNF